MESLYTGDGEFVPESMENLQKTVERFKEFFKPLSASVETCKIQLELNSPGTRFADVWEKAIGNLTIQTGIFDTIQTRSIKSALDSIIPNELKDSIGEFQSALAIIGTQVSDSIQEIDIEILEGESQTDTIGQKEVFHQRRKEILLANFSWFKKEVKHMIKKDGLASPDADMFIDWFLTKGILSRIGEGRLPDFLGSEEVPEIYYSDFVEYTKFIREKGNPLALMPATNKDIERFEDIIPPDLLHHLVDALRKLERINDLNKWLGKKYELVETAKALRQRGYLSVGFMHNEQLVPLIAKYFQTEISKRSTRDTPKSKFDFMKELIAILPQLQNAKTAIK